MSLAVAGFDEDGDGGELILGRGVRGKAICQDDEDEDQEDEDAVCEDDEAAGDGRRVRGHRLPGRGMIFSAAGGLEGCDDAAGFHGENILSLNNRKGKKNESR